MSRSASWTGVVAVWALAAAVGATWVNAFREPLIQRVRVTAVVEERDPRTEPNSISGTVVEWTDAGRMPVAHGTVALVGPDGARREVVPDAWGRYAFTDVVPGVVYEVRAESADGRRARVPGIVLRPAERRQVGPLQLAQAKPWVVRVTDEDGTPLAGAEVEVFREAFDRFESIEGWRERVLEIAPTPLARATTDATGAAALDVSPSCRVTVAARAPGRARVAEALCWPHRGEHGIALPPPCSFTGQVVDARGRPVAGALVLARGRPPVIDSYHGRRAASAALWARTTSDAAGRFAFDALPPGPVDVRAGRAGTAPRTEDWLDLPAMRSVVLELPDPVRVRGRVTEFGTGAPVAGVVVRTAQEYDECDATGITSADGTYEIEWTPADDRDESPWERLAPTAGWVVVRTEGGDVHASAAPGDVVTTDFVVARAASLAGRVTGLVPDDAGAHVCVALASAEPAWHGHPVAETFADGTFRRDDHDPEVVRIASFPWTDGWFGDSSTAWSLAAERAPGLLARTHVTLRSSSLVEVELAVTRGTPESDATTDPPLRERKVRLRVHVTTRDGLPLRGARVDVGDHRLDSRGRWDFRGDPVGPDGRATVEETVYGDDTTCRVVAWDARHLVTGADVEIPDTDEAEVPVAIVLEPALTVRGRVEGPDGPIAGAVVSTEGRMATTDASGAFSFRTADRKPGYVLVTADGFVRAWFDVPKPQTAASPRAPALDTTPKPGGCDCCRAAAATSRQAEDLGPVADPPEMLCRLEPGGTARGRVVRENGAPVRGLVATLLDADGDDRARTFTDDDGAFAFPLVELRPHTVRISSRRGDERAIRIVETQVDPRATESRAVVVREGLTITGRVTTPRGLPAQVHRLRWERLPGPGETATFGPAWRGEVRVAADGAFRISGLDDGEILLTVHLASPPSVTVRARAGTANVRVEVRPDAER
jgi:protocatechuate 3,4-dioxygenase beta subunit